MKNPTAVRLVISLILTNSLGTILAQAPSKGTVKSYQKISDTAGAFTTALDNEDRFGRSVAALGDLAEDGVADLAGVAHKDDDGGYDRGAVYVLFLAPTDLVAHYSFNGNANAELYNPLIDLTFTEVGAGAGVDDNTEGYGVAWGDYDNDGDLDLYLVNGAYPGNHPNRLYRNNNDGTFTELGAAAGVDHNGDGHGGAWGDYDNDGDLDLYVSNASGQTDRLFKNNGDGTFTEIGGSVGISAGGTGRSVAWADYDQDSDLDLYVANNGTNRLYRNNGNGTFTDVGSSAGVSDAGNGRGVAWGDYDNDGDLDLYVINESTNHLYRNNGDGTFSELGSGAGVAHSGDGAGAAWGDYDNDGDLDLYLTNQYGPNELYRNNGDATFTAVGGTAGVNDSNDGHSAAWADFDNDGDVDLYVTNVDTTNILYQNNGEGTFSDVGAAAGVNDAGIGPGAAWGDYDKDGDLDLYVANRGGTSNRLFQNQGTNNHWLIIKLIGTSSNLDGIGARVITRTGNLRQIREVDGGSGYLSQPSLPIEFGFGSNATVDSIIIRWPSGIVWDTTNVAVNQFLTITEKTDLVAYYPFNGNADDASGNGHDGIVNGATLAEDRFGNPNSAYSFNDNDINIGQGWDSPNGAISMWIYQTSSGGGQRFLSDRTGFDNYLSLFVNSSNEIGSRIQETDQYDLGQVLAIETGKWYHVAFLWGSTGMNLYLDGILHDSNTETGSWTANSDMLIGNSQAYPSQGWIGKIDDIRIYNRALSEAEIDSLYRLGSWLPPDPPANLTATPGDGQVVLHWTPNTEPDFLRYRIYMSTPPFPITLIDSTIDILDTTYTINGLVNGTTYTFYLSVVDTNLNESELTAGINATPGAVSTTSNGAMPSEYALHAAYPNPFNPTTTLRFALPRASLVSLVIYNLQGQEMFTLLDRKMQAGYHKVVWDGKTADGHQVSTGIYIARLVTPEYSSSIKMVLLK